MERNFALEYRNREDRRKQANELAKEMEQRRFEREADEARYQREIEL